MQNQSYNFRTSLWAQEFGTVFSNDTLETLGCYYWDSSVWIILQNQKRYTAAFEVLATPRIDFHNYLVLKLQTDSGDDVNSATAVAVAEIMDQHSCRIINSDELSQLKSTVDVVDLIQTAGQLQTKIDLLQLGVIQDPNLEQSKFSVDQLKRMGIYLNAQGHGKVSTKYYYSVASCSKYDDAYHLKLASKTTAYPEMEFEVYKIIFTESSTYCVLTLTGADRAEEDRPFFAVLKKVSERELVSLSITEAESMSGTIVAACHDGCRPTDRDFEKCFANTI